MLKKKVSNKFFAIFLVLLVTLLSSVCCGALQWTYLMDLSYGMDRTTYFGRNALDCFGTTSVEGIYGAGVIVLLETIDEDGDWVTVTGWSDYDTSCAAVEDVHAVGSGTYRLKVSHTAYAEDDTDFENPLERHVSYSEELVYN